jgi:hypothetical protein
MGFGGGKLRAYHLKPYDENISQAHADFLDWVQTSLNTLIGQKLNTVGTGFSGLQNPQLNPATQLTSTGARVSAISTVMSGISIGGAGTTVVTFYYDGTNNSTIFQIHRDDNTTTTPLPGAKVVSSLIGGGIYYFYPYFEVSSGQIKWVSLPTFVGTPNIALANNNVNFAALDIQARRQTILSNNIPLWTVTTLGVVGPVKVTIGSTSNQWTTRAGSGY